MSRSKVIWFESYHQGTGTGIQIRIATRINLEITNHLVGVRRHTNCIAI